MAVSQLIGASIKRREDPELITGTGSFVVDLPQTAVAHLYVVRSPQAHARILGPETSRARDAGGVLAVWPGEPLIATSPAPLPPPVRFAA